MNPFDRYVFEPAKTSEDGKRIVFDVHNMHDEIRRVVSKAIAPELIEDTILKIRSLGHTPVCVVNCKRK